ncbi:MAG: transcription antitermination factor NusB [Chloroflexota bacterium]
MAGRRGALVPRSPEAQERSVARRDALTALYEAEFGLRSPREILDRRVLAGDVPEGVGVAARELLGIVERHRPDLDALIQRLAPAFPLATMHRIERSILRCGLGEVLHSRAAAPAEAIAGWTALARTYSGEPARRLVNGVLGTAHRGNAGAGEEGGSPT